MHKPSAAAHHQSLKALDALNFFLADIQGGVAPFLVVYLTASLHWHPAQIGLVMALSGIFGVLAQTPAGALIDRIHQKRLLVGGAALLIAVSSIIMVQIPTFPVIVSTQSVTAIVGAVFGPAIAATSLGLVGRKNLDRRIGRNQSISSAGNVIAALLAGLIGRFISRAGIFYFIAAMSVAVIFSVLLIREADINYDLARGAEDEDREQAHVSNIMELLEDRRILIFALSAVLFHFANAAMLPLVGEVLATRKGSSPSLYMSACIIVAQLVIIPLGIGIGRWASFSRRKPIYLIAFTVLPVRGVLYTLSSNPYFLISVQILDGIGGGIFGMMQLLVIADLTRGTGRFNLTQGAIGTSVGIGASLSNLVTGFVVKQAGYNAGFLTMAAIAGIALLVFGLAMPETKARESRNRQ